MIVLFWIVASKHVAQFNGIFKMTNAENSKGERTGLVHKL